MEKRVAFSSVSLQSNFSWHMTLLIVKNFGAAKMRQYLLIYKHLFQFTFRELATATLPTVTSSDFEGRKIISRTKRSVLIAEGNN
jgi:hypothetical protein